MKVGIISLAVRLCTLLTRFFLSLRIGEHTFLYVLAALIGIGGGFGAVLFRWMIRIAHFLFLEKAQVWLGTTTSRPWLFPLLPALGGLFVGVLTYFFAREAKGHGVPEVMAAVAVQGGVIRPRVTAVKALASAICIGSGGAVGREGPIVQIGSAFASSVGQLFRLPEQYLRILVGCGAAAGIAATFNAPIGGMLFALEIILGEFSMQVFTPIIIATVLADVVARMFLGNEPAFLIPAYELVHAVELAHYVVLGCVIGLLAVAFTRALYKVEDLFDALSIPEYLKPVIGGLLIGAIGLLFPRGIGQDPPFFGVGYEAITDALYDRLPLIGLFLYFGARFAATVLTLGSGGSGGIFAPSLFMGAMVGTSFGRLAQALFPQWTASPGAYGLVGMAAMVGGATHAPLTAGLILFELTNNYTIILPLLLATGIGSILARLIERESIYTLKLTRRGIQVRTAPDLSVLEKIRVAEAFTTEFPCVSVTTPMQELVALFEQTHAHDIPVLDEEGRFMGMLHFRDLRPVLFDRGLYPLIIAGDLVSGRDATLSPSNTLADALMKFNAEGTEELPVVDEADPHRLVGILSRISLMRRYQQELFPFMEQATVWEGQEG